MSLSVKWYIVELNLNEKMKITQKFNIILYATIFNLIKDGIEDQQINGNLEFRKVTINS